MLSGPVNASMPCSWTMIGKIKSGPSECALCSCPCCRNAEIKGKMKDVGSLSLWGCLEVRPDGFTSFLVLLNGR